jgi:Leucine-rich repeat (LRR) protein
MKLYKSLAQALKAPDDVLTLKISVDGKLPPELARFPFLKELHLEGNCPDLDETLLHLQKLETLWLRFPNLQDTSLLFRLPRLKNLKLVETRIPRLLLPLGHPSCLLKSLTLKGAGLASLPDEIGTLAQLEELNLSGNQLSVLPPGLGDLKQLKRLNLDQNAFKIFPDLVGSIPSLIHLSIDGNLFSEEEKARIQRNFHLWPL